jgi:hypothetical protein
MLGDRFGCATPDEAVSSHRLWVSALASHRDRALTEVG